TPVWKRYTQRYTLDLEKPQCLQALVQWYAYLPPCAWMPPLHSYSYSYSPIFFTEQESFSRSANRPGSFFTALFAAFCSLLLPRKPIPVPPARPMCSIPLISGVFRSSQELMFIQDL